MQDKTASHIIAIHFSGADNNQAPRWVHVIPSGTFTGVDGRGPYVVEDASDIIARFNADGRKLPIDENHAIDLATKSGLPSPARGWITALEARDDGIWAKVDWTDEGSNLVASHAYGYLSPVFFYGAAKPHKVRKLLRVALTNDPNLTSLTALHSKESNMDIVALRNALGLPDTADEAQITQALIAAHSAQQAHAALLNRLAGVAGIEDATNSDALLTALQAKMQPAPTNDAEKDELKSQLISLQSRVQQLASDKARSDAERVIDEAIAGGKIVPALREHFIARHSRNPQEVAQELALMPSLNAGGLGGRVVPSADGQPSSDELQVAAMMGVDPEAFKAQHKALHGKGL